MMGYFILIQVEETGLTIIRVPFGGGLGSLNPGRYGKMSGYEKILIASIVKEMLVEAMNPSYNPSNSDLFKGIDKGVCAGLRLWSRHFECGFPSDSKNFPKNYIGKR